LIELVGVVFSNGTMLSVLDKSDSVNKRTQEISKLTKLHILGVWQNSTVTNSEWRSGVVVARWS